MKRLLVLAAVCLACATTGRRPVGELVVRPLHEQVPSTKVIHDAILRLENGRVVFSGSSAGALDLVTLEDGCLRGSVRGQSVQVCPGTPAPDNKNLVWWHSTGLNVVGFSTELVDTGDRLHVTANGIDADFPLPQGPVGDELRRHPEFLGAAFAFGLIPPSADSRELWAYSTEAR